MTFNSSIPQIRITDEMRAKLDSITTRMQQDIPSWKLADTVRSLIIKALKEEK